MSKAKHKHEPFVMVIRETLDSPAWRAMSHGARSLFVALKRRYNANFKNNGRIFLSQRDAMKEIGSGFSQIVRWFRELQHYGFIVQTAAGHLGVDGKGKAPHWRLTEVGYTTDPPTRDFLRWDGLRFSEKQCGKKLESRYGKPEQSAPENQSTPAMENQSTSPEKRSRKPEHTDAPTAMENQSITRIPSTGAAALAVAPPGPPSSSMEMPDIPDFLRREPRALLQ